MSVLLWKEIFKPLFHSSFPKAAIKSREAKERRKSEEKLKARRKGEQVERGIIRKKINKSVKLNASFLSFKKIKVSESMKEIYKSL